MHSKKHMKLNIQTALSYLVSLLVPLILIGTAVRILLSPLYYTVEYNMPYFPADEYGMTKEERLQWAPYAVDYLVNDADISYLGNLKFDNGDPLYNERELSHMVDVKNVVQGALRTWYLSLALLLILALIAYRFDLLNEFFNGLRRGGWWMIGLAIAIAFIVGVGILIDPNVFWEFFSAFHSLFFEGDSWLFYFSDTLIRLFPIRFWQDAFLAAAVIALGGGLALAFGLKRFQA
jgi:integral membrane protein (TIGR01906 family)